MKHLFTIAVLFQLMLPVMLTAQCSETPVTRVLLIGDSWAQFMGSDNSINTALSRWGHSNYKFFTNATLAEAGTVTTDFLDPARLAEIQNQLTLHPDIDLVHLSLGGNDVLNTWNVNYTTFQTDSLLDSVYARLTTIIDFIKVARPGVTVVWSGYAYPNFGEIISELAPFQNTHPFYNLWQGMGFPTFIQLNDILNTYSAKMEILANNDPQVEFVRATGLMQYLYGQTTALSVPPGGTYAPFTATLPDGFSDYPSPKSSMRYYVIFRDCFHLAPAAYDLFFEYQTRKFYQKALMDDQYFISEGGTREGSVSDAGNVSTSLQLGFDGTANYATMLSFDTQSMPDTGVAKASIFLQRSALSGSNPSTGPLQIKIIKGAFSTSADIEAADFGAPGNATDVPCQFGAVAADGNWIRLELPSTLLPYISNDTLTQFLISASGATGIVTFTGAADPELAPVLNITYGPAPLGITETTFTENDVMVYPNPTSGVVQVSANGQRLLSIELFTVSGQRITAPLVSETSLDLSGMASGLYFVKITTDHTVVTKRIVKQ